MHLLERLTCKQRFEVGERFAKHLREEHPMQGPKEGRPGGLEELQKARVTGAA